MYHYGFVDPLGYTFGYMG